MEQSIYTRLSKSIGSQSEMIDLPTLAEAENLFKDVTENHSEEAFTKVFRFYRLGKNPQTFAEEEIYSLIIEAFTIGSKHFRL